MPPLAPPVPCAAPHACRARRRRALPRLASASASPDAPPLSAPRTAAWFSTLRRAEPPLRSLLDALCPLRGWAALDAIETRASPMHGRGVFALRPLRVGELLGEYPGVVGAASAVWAKCSAPRSKGALGYAFQLDSGAYIDPTDDEGALRATELAWWGPLCTDATLARINEPSAAAQRANVAAVESPQPGFENCLFVGVTRPVAAGEELLLSYGDNYDRSGYAAGA